MVRIAIVSMTKQPIDYDEWLRYHLHMVDYLFLQIEDTPGLDNLVRQYGDRIRYEITSSKNVMNQYEDLQKRQIRFINQTITRCIHMGIDYLLHIDDDELLYVSSSHNYSIKELLKKNHHKYHSFDNLHLTNLEAVYQHPQSCFHTNKFIDCSQNSCRSYANGKSIGKISSRLRSNGPHYFNGSNHDINKNDACILHFDTCIYQKWQQKFNNLMNSNMNKIPFKYYRDSISKIQECHQQCSSSDLLCRSCHDEMKSLWKKYTSSENYKNIIRIDLNI